MTISVAESKKKKRKVNNVNSTGGGGGEAGEETKGSNEMKKYHDDFNARTVLLKQLYKSCTK